MNQKNKKQKVQKKGKKDNALASYSVEKLEKRFELCCKTSDLAASVEEFVGVKFF